MLKKFARLVLPTKLLKRLQPARKQARNFKSLAREYGQWRTIRDWDSVDSNGEPIPWYTYPATEFLSHINFSRFKVFEYGSGNSTLWWSKRAKQVTSVEDHDIWFRRINSKIAADSNNNITYRLEKGGQQYFSMATSEYDIFLVDGSHRRECLEHIVTLGGGVMLVLDNSDWYPKSVRFIKEKLGWMQVDFHGFGPINNYTWTTSIFINPALHQELTYHTPLKSACGLVQVADGDY